MDRIRVQRLEGVSDERTRPVTPATVNREFAFLRRVFNIALRDGEAESNPVAKLKALERTERQGALPDGRGRAAADEGVARRTKAETECTVLLHTGFRRGELLGLRWRDVDFKAGVLTIPKSKNGETPICAHDLDGPHSYLQAPTAPGWSRRSCSPNSEGHRDLRWATKTVPAALRAGEGSRVSGSMTSAIPSPVVSPWRVLS